jgi:hypothetical protein
MKHYETLFSLDRPFSKHFKEKTETTFSQKLKSLYFSSVLKREARIIDHAEIRTPVSLCTYSFSAVLNLIIKVYFKLSYFNMKKTKNLMESPARLELL